MNCDALHIIKSKHYLLFFKQKTRISELILNKNKLSLS